MVRSGPQNTPRLIRRSLSIAAKLTCISFLNWQDYLWIFRGGRLDRVLPFLKIFRNLRQFDRILIMVRVQSDSISQPVLVSFCVASIV